MPIKKTVKKKVSAKATKKPAEPKKGKRVIISAKKPKKSTKALKKSEREALLRLNNTIKAFYRLVDEDENLYLMFNHPDFCIVIKKKVVNINKVVNPNSMQPFEKSEQATVFDTFALQWGNDVWKTTYFQELLRMGMEVVVVGTPEAVTFALRDK